MLVSRWTVDYGDGTQVARVPHVWGQDASIEWDGPAVYRTEVEVPRGGGTLRFHGVSYAAEVYANGELVGRHSGIWDAFDVQLPGGKVDVVVRVVKSGGTRHPVRDVLGGFLPYLYGTFGGIYREVELLDSEEPRQQSAAPSPELPYVRGLLHWGWYPELGHPNPDETTIRKEVRAAKTLGFNLVKFCLWVPPHRYLDILQEEGMLAWMELPLWEPNLDRLQAMGDEIERIVLQYRHHPSIAIWTIGCQVAAVPYEFRKEMVDLVEALTGCDWVKDGAGGAENVSGDLREAGWFDDFHPYCDLPFYPPVLDSLASGSSPVLLGEFGDHDVHRDLARLGDEMPYWASALPELNAKGVRRQYDLPEILDTSRFSHEPTKSRHRALMESSRKRALFVRKTAVEATRARPGIKGYVIAGWRDTPVSSSGFFDDWDTPRFSPKECAAWNGSSTIYRLPSRCPSWKNGGDRPGWLDPFASFEGKFHADFGMSGDREPERNLSWRIVNSEGEVAARGLTTVPSVDLAAGEYRLEARSGGVENEWPLWVVKRPDWAKCDGWRLHDPAGLLPELSDLPGGERVVAVRRPCEGAGGVLLVDEEGTLPMPFWRESALEFEDPTLERWERLLPVSPDRALDPSWLRSQFGDYKVLINRIDTRSYQEHPILVRAGNWLVTTLRPQGGLGSQPPGLQWNPAGCAFLERLMGDVE